MRWERSRRSTNVEDRRGVGLSPIVKGGGIGGILLVVVALLFGVDPSSIEIPSTNTEAPPENVSGPEQDQQVEFVRAVLGDTEDTWNSLFSARGASYAEPRLVLFTQAVQSACGMAESAVGPFYCPGDNQVYIDLSFYDELQRRFQAPGDFAQAYVIAHEVGHHVQNLMGTSAEVRNLQQRSSAEEANQWSVRLELQADCYAGIWAFHADRSRQILETGDVNEALTAASAIGDDRLQRQAQGHVVPESFTHGSSEQRVRWFNRGFESGRPEDCDTFNSEQL